jgi:hypothetical protein
LLLILFSPAPSNRGKCNGVMQGTGEERERRIVLAKPFTVGEETDVDYRAPNPLQLVLSLFKNVLPGSDLTKFQASQHSRFQLSLTIWER